MLQDDFFSPLTFNLLINTFIQYIKHDNFQQLGYKYLQHLKPRHWYQFIDDAVVVTGLESENQILLNAFSRWCTWADMLIRVDKCHAFSMKKVNSQSKQFQPKLYVNNKLIPPVKQDEHYLERYFDFKMSNDKHKENLINTTKELLSTINNLPIYPRNKLLIYHRYLLSKISWDLTVADINLTWIKQSLDSIVNQQARFWLEIPISGTLDIISLSKSKYGIGFITISSRFSQCQTTLRNCMRNSPNTDYK